VWENLEFPLAASWRFLHLQLFVINAGHASCLPGAACGATSAAAAIAAPRQPPPAMQPNHVTRVHFALEAALL